jgi:regulator of sigma E protease
MLLTLIIFILILSFLILIHELGHFVAAKKAGLLVHEFGLGLPPKIWGKKHGETEYTLNALPIGGFVKIEGEDPSEPGGIKNKERNFQFKPPRVKLVILLAGVFMNFMLAVVLYYFFFVFNTFLSNPLVVFSENYNFFGANELKIETLVSGVSNEDLAESLKSGDVIFNVINDQSGQSLNSLNPADVSTMEKRQRVEAFSTVSLSDFENYLSTFTGPATLYVFNIQDETVRDVAVEITYNEDLDKNVVGIFLGELLFLDYKLGGVKQLLSGFTHSANMIGYSMKSFAALIGFSFQTRDISVVSDGVSGPVGIFSVVQTVLVSNNPDTFWIIVDLTALISLSLAFMNLLPIPALDGGRAIFVLVEAITGKPVNPKIENSAHKWGMIFLLGLLAIITLKDVINLF